MGLTHASDSIRGSEMGPLEGIKILDFTQAHAGSLATMLLADFGAEVIKIERAGVGDLARYWEPIKNDESGYFAFLNRNKKSISLDANSAEGKEIIFTLVKEVDVVCENFKYGSMERLGFAYETFKNINPKIIYASLNGFGQTGVMKNTIGLDLQLQAMSGIMAETGKDAGIPIKIGAALGDHISGIYMALAVNLALINMKKNGVGQRIDISILDSLCSIFEEHVILEKSVEEISGDKDTSVSKVCTVSEAMTSVQLLSRDMLHSSKTCNLDEVKFPGIPIKLEKTAGEIRFRAPIRGEHTKYYLERIGYETDDIESLVTNGIIECAEGERV